MISLNRRNFLFLLSASVGSVTLGAYQASGDPLTTPTSQFSGTSVAQNPTPFQVPPLPYEYQALEPHIDAKTMQFHHDKHHAAYVKNLNNALAKHPELIGKSGEELLRNIKKIPEDIRTTIRNNGGGHVNHTMFWEIMGPNAGGEPNGMLADAIQQTFGSFAAFQEKFNDVGAQRFGSGWVWLVRTKAGKLEIMSTANQDSPFMENHYPILGNDVWEHAYYLNYQNRRPDYLKAWWNVVNWDAVNQRYQQAMR